MSKKEKQQMAVRTGYKNRPVSSVSYETYGNTVRVAEPYVREPRRRQRPAEPVKGQKAAARKPQAREQEYRKNLRIGMPTVFMLTLVFAATVYIVYSYLYLSASVASHMDTVEALEVQLEDLRNENDALEQSIDTSIDLNYVYNVAVNELGMVHAGEDNTIRYDKTESEYVRQYESITKP